MSTRSPAKSTAAPVTRTEVFIPLMLALGAIVLVVVALQTQRHLNRRLALVEADMHRRLDGEKAAAKNGADLRRVAEGTFEQSLEPE